MAAGLLTGVCVLSARMGDRLVACAWAASAGFVVGVGLARHAHKNSRPSVRPDEACAAAAAGEDKWERQRRERLNPWAR